MQAKLLRVLRPRQEHIWMPDQTSGLKYCPGLMTSARCKRGETVPETQILTGFVTKTQF
jgi:hypothetical protein